MKKLTNKLNLNSSLVIAAIFIGFSFQINAQDSLSIKAKFVKDYVNDYHLFNKELDKISRNFYYYNKISLNDGNEIIDMFLNRNEIIKEHLRLRFFKNQYDYFTKEQRAKIKKFLTQNLNFGDESYII